MSKGNGSKKGIGANKQFGNNVNVSNSMMHINIGKSVNLNGVQSTGAKKNMSLNQSYDG
jgi:hypothetical protein